MLGPIGPPGSWDVDAFRQTIEINLVGTLLSVLSLLAPLRAGHGAVVAFSGGGATSPLPRFDAYAASKAAVVRLVNLAVELAPDGVRINCVAPGFVATAIHQATIDAGPQLAGDAYYERTRRALDVGGDSADTAAELTAFLLSHDAEGITGRLLRRPVGPVDRSGLSRAPAQRPRPGPAPPHRRPGFHGASAASPRSQIRISPLFLICPNTGSTTCWRNR